MHELKEEIKATLSFHQALMGNLIFLPESMLPGDLPSLDRQESEASVPEKIAAREATTLTMSSTRTVTTLSAFSFADEQSFVARRRIFEMIPEDSPVRAIDSLEELETFVRETRMLPIDAQRMNPVFGVGNPGADLMLIGEAPGADEDRQGEPFVGRAGKLLNKILAAVDFDRSDVYITNILKSRPPNNRNPLPDEIGAHIPVLYRQISLIQPKLILSLGKVSASALLQSTESLGAMRGRLHDYHGIPLLVTYHPAALLRNPHWKRPTWEDVQLLRRTYDELVSQK